MRKEKERRGEIVFRSEKLSEYLREKEITQVEFARLVGCTREMIHYLCKGYKQPSAALLKRIATQMNCTMEELLW